MRGKKITSKETYIGYKEINSIKLDRVSISRKIPNPGKTGKQRKYFRSYYNKSDLLPQEN